MPGTLLYHTPLRVSSCARLFEDGVFGVLKRGIEPRAAGSLAVACSVCTLAIPLLAAGFDSPLVLWSRPCPSAARVGPTPSSFARSPGQPALSGCVARVEVGDLHFRSVLEVLPRGLAGVFSGSPSDYRVASFRSSTLAIFFPSWVTRESAIGRSPLRFEGNLFSFSNWVEVGEEARGRLFHKVWIRLVNWPILCWNKENVKAVVSGFGEFWESDKSSSELKEVSSYRVCIRCVDVGSIPEVLNLMVEDRRFRIPIVVDSWEDASPILLGENLDHHLGLDSSEAQ